MTEFHFICSIILWLNESDFLTYMVRTWKSTSYQKCHSVSRSISPSTLQPGLTRRVPRLTSAFLIACWDLWEGQGPVKTVWMGRWGKPCDFSASLPLRCVQTSGTHPRRINGGRWLDRTMVTCSSGGCTEPLSLITSFELVCRPRDREEARCSTPDTYVYVLCSLNSWEMLCTQTYISCRACPKSQPCLPPSTGVSCSETPIYVCFSCTCACEINAICGRAALLLCGIIWEWFRAD